MNLGWPGWFDYPPNSCGFVLCIWLVRYYYAVVYLHYAQVYVESICTLCWWWPQFAVWYRWISTFWYFSGYLLFNYMVIKCKLLYKLRSSEHRPFILCVLVVVVLVVFVWVILTWTQWPFHMAIEHCIFIKFEITEIVRGARR